MISLLSWNDKRLELDMGMSQRDFAKARLLPLLEEEGLVVCLERRASSENPLSWRFTEVVQQGDTIKIAGERFEGRSLFEFLPLGEGAGQTDLNTRLELLKAVFQAMELVLEKKPGFHFAGPLQIIISSSTPKKILFLPPTLLQRAIESLNQREQALMLGYFQNPLLQGKTQEPEALAFSQSVYLYLSLAGQLPFPEEKKEQRTIDCRDRNFLPLELLVAGVSEEVATTINNNLQLGSASICGGKIGIQEKIKDKGQGLAARTEPVLLGRFLSGLSAENLVRETSQTEISELQQRRQDYQLQQEKKLGRRRFIRKNTTPIKIGAVAVLLLLIALGMGLKDRQNEFVATGLTPPQVCQVLYTALNEQNLVMAKAMCQGRETEDFQDRLSNFFVSNRMRTGMNPTSLSMTPDQWLLYLEQKQGATSEAASQPQRDVWIYGLTNFSLQIENERTSQLPLYPPQRRDKTRPTGDLPSLPVEALANYTIVFNDSPTSFQIQNYKDHIVLEYIKDSWQVVSIKQDVQIETVEIAQVEEAFTQLLQESGENLASATEKLVQQYPWIQ